jgi:hypothetical protein
VKGMMVSGEGWSEWVMSLVVVLGGLVLGAVML